MPAASSDLPESRPGQPVAFCLVLLRMGFTYALPVTGQAVVSYTALPTLPEKVLRWAKLFPAVHFCCTVLGVASTGCYPASYPVKPGLSSSKRRNHLFYLVYQPLLLFIFSCMKNASADKLPADRIAGHQFTANTNKIL